MLANILAVLLFFFITFICTTGGVIIGYLLLHFTGIQRIPDITISELMKELKK